MSLGRYLPVCLVHTCCLHCHGKRSNTSPDRNNLKETSWGPGWLGSEVEGPLCLITCVKMVCRLELVWECMSPCLEKRKAGYHSRLPVHHLPARGKQSHVFPSEMSKHSRSSSGWCAVEVWAMVECAAASTGWRQMLNSNFLPPTCGPTLVLISQEPVAVIIPPSCPLTDWFWPLTSPSTC